MWVFDTPRKKLVLYSLFLHYPILSLIVGAPIPFPSVMTVTPEQIAIFNFASLLITIMGSIVGVGFYLERRNNLKAEAQTKKIDVVNEHIDESVIAVRVELKELRNEMSNGMREMEKRICDSVGSKNHQIEKVIEEKVTTARELVDTKFRHIEDITKELRSNLQNMERGYHRSNKYSQNNGVDE